MIQPILSIQNISRIYKTGDNIVKALDDVSLDIQQGEFVAIVGSSGSGKTTLMNIIGCLDTPTSGTYLVGGKDVSNLDTDEKSDLRRDVFGFIFQSYNLLALSDAHENVEMPSVYAGMSKEMRRTRATKLLDQLGLKDRAHHLPNELSGGQQQRVAIARALMNKPSIILADEPTGALDSKSGEEVLQLLKDLHQEGHTIILITHDSKVAEHADRTIKMQDGNIIDESNNGKITTGNISPSLSRKDAPHLGSNTLEAVRTALRSLRTNLFRTALTLLGIVIGVASVITLLAVGNGSKQRIIDQINDLGSDIVNVRPDYSNFHNSTNFYSLRISDTDSLISLPNISAISAKREAQKTLRFGNKDYSVSIEGVSPSFAMLQKWSIAQGYFFNDHDMESYAPVIVLGDSTAKELFEPTENPINKYIMVENIPFKVIGVMSPKGATPWGTDQDEVAFIPASTGLVRLFSGNHISSIILRLKDMEQFEKTKSDIISALKINHPDSSFRVRSASSYLEAAAESQQTITILLAAVAAISLLVGGIGVMNIMLVSVTERIREIGIRIATGARQRDIMIQFNTESAVICTIGGLFGIVLGFLGGWVLSLFEIDIIFTLMPVALSFGCAVSTGIIFGYLPAHKAARVDPVTALSNE